MMTGKDYLYKIPIVRKSIFRIVNKKRVRQETMSTPQRIGKGRQIYKKSIYVIRWVNPSAGLFAYVLNIMGEIWYAKQHDFVPVIDMQSYPNTYIRDDEVGKVNAWEYYFQRVSELTLEDCDKYSNVYVSDGKGKFYSPCPSVGWINDKKEVIMWRRLAAESLVLNNEAMRFCDEDYRSMILKEDRVLGVKCRGTDYNSKSAKGHPVQPEIERVIEKAQFVMKKYDLNKLYLSSEDKNIVMKFKKVFGNKLLYSTSIRVDYDMDLKSCISLYSTKRENDRYLKGLEYLRDTYILSKCNCLLSGINGGGCAALIMGDFEYTYFWYLGRY